MSLTTLPGSEFDLDSSSKGRNHSTNKVEEGVPSQQSPLSRSPSPSSSPSSVSSAKSQNYSYSKFVPAPSKDDNDDDEGGKGIQNATNQVQLFDDFDSMGLKPELLRGTFLFPLSSFHFPLSTIHHNQQNKLTINQCNIKISNIKYQNIKYQISNVKCQMK